MTAERREELEATGELEGPREEAMRAAPARSAEAKAEAAPAAAAQAAAAFSKAAGAAPAAAARAAAGSAPAAAAAQGPRWATSFSVLLADQQGYMYLD